MNSVRENGKTIRDMGKARSHGVQNPTVSATHTLVIGSKIAGQVMVFMHMPTVCITRENGKTVRCMEKVK